MSALALAVVLATLPATPELVSQPARGEDLRPVATLSQAEREAAVRSDTDSVKDDLRRYAELRAARHPNESYRLAATDAANRGDWTRAASQFRTAARYADKYSQHRLSLLHWYGVGVSENRVEGYIWADLAAERGYPQFLAIREKMWEQLTERERAQVAAQGPARYAEFGDAVAKKRFSLAIAIARQNIAGSRTGFDHGVIAMPAELISGRGLPSLSDAMALGEIYSARRNRPEQYWAQEDKIWRESTVTVGEIEETGRTPAADAKPED